MKNWLVSGPKPPNFLDQDEMKNLMVQMKHKHIGPHSNHNLSDFPFGKKDKKKNCCFKIQKKGNYFRFMATEPNTESVRPLYLCLLNVKNLKS